MRNKVQLITYVDRFGGGDLNTLQKLISGSLKDCFGGVHLLPFFYPVDGEDAGFDPIDHAFVDPKLGNWEDIRALSKEVDIMADLIVNHMSADSSQFQDVLEKGNESEYEDLFLTLGKVFPNGVTEEELTKIYRPRPGLPFSTKVLQDDSQKIFWTTFTPKQIDINVTHPLGKAYLENILQKFKENGISMIRIDAAGYAIKTPGTSCFMTPETFEFIGELAATAGEMGMEVLVEIHSYYKQQIQIATKVDWVYDFALPPLILHTLFQQNAQRLKNWLDICPRNAISVLDTHDGIGIVDVGAGTHPGEEKGLVDPESLDKLVDQIHLNSQGQSRKATGESASNLDLYQVNCTFYDALGRDDRKYLLARLIQFFSPGIPHVYYVGLLAGENDMDLLAKTQVGRDINRHYYSLEEVEDSLNKPVVKKLLSLIQFRNSHPAFDGVFSLLPTSSETLGIRWENGLTWIELNIDFAVFEFEIAYTEGDRIRRKTDFKNYAPGKQL